MNNPGGPSRVTSPPNVMRAFSDMERSVSEEKPSPGSTDPLFVHFISRHQGFYCDR